MTAHSGFDAKRLDYLTAAVERDASDVMKRWDVLRTSDLPALNHTLNDARLPEVKIESDPHKEEGGMDEE